MKNSTFKEISKVLMDAEAIMLFPHINMDGDALGSSIALCRALRKAGKKCYILIKESVPKNLNFLDKGFCITDENIVDSSFVSVCIDCGDEGRISERIDTFRKGIATVCVDHHATTQNFCNYNYIDSKAAATGELVYELIKALGVDFDKEIGEAIFAAIITDTRNFQYSNTTKKTHEIVANLYDLGIDSNGVSLEIYERVPLEKIKTRTVIMSTLTTFLDNKVAVAYVTEDMLKKIDASMEETEGIVSELRSIDTVEIAMFLKGYDNGETKVSLRAKRIGDVAEIVTKFGGGGHKKAAGCTLKCNVNEAIKTMMVEIEENLKKYDN